MSSCLKASGCMATFDLSVVKDFRHQKLSKSVPRNDFCCPLLRQARGSLGCGGGRENQWLGHFVKTVIIMCAGWDTVDAVVGRMSGVIQTTSMCRYLALRPSHGFCMVYSSWINVYPTGLLFSGSSAAATYGSKDRHIESEDCITLVLSAAKAKQLSFWQDPDYNNAFPSVSVSATGKDLNPHWAGFGQKVIPFCSDTLQDK